MGAVFGNGLVIIFASSLIFAPSIVWSLYRQPSVTVLAGGSALTVAVASGITYLTGTLGVGSIMPLRALAILLAVVLLWAIVRSALLVHRKKYSAATTTDAMAFTFGIGTGIWILVPPLVALRQQGLTFGLVTMGNADLPNYVLLAEQTASAGFANNNHLANVDLGSQARELSYIGASALINFVSAGTGLPAWQATFATMGVAVSLLVVALCALGRAFWPTANYSIIAAVLVATLASLSCLTYGQFFLAGVLGLAGVTTSLAGATLIARGEGGQGLLAIVGGGAIAVYSYAQLGLPALLMLPFWAIVAAKSIGGLAWGNLLKIGARAATAVSLAVLLSAIYLPTAFNLIRTQSHIQAGWTMPVLTSQAALVWPTGIARHSSRSTVIGSWAIVLVVAIFALTCAWRWGLRASAVLCSVITVSILVVVAGVVYVYGPDRYQAWKMEAFLLPIAIVLTLPALSAVSINNVRVGRTVLAAGVGAVLLAPFASWTPALSQPNPAVITTSPLASLAHVPALAKVASLNIRLSSAFETMSAGAILTKSVVIFTRNSDYPAEASLRTCTLTTRSMLAPGETDVVDLGGGYVLLERPSKCAMRK